MNKDQREIQRKLRILSYADEIGHVAKACRYFGVGRASFYRWRAAYQKHSESGLINRPSIPKQHYNRTPWKLKKRFFIYVVNTTWDQSGSFGIWSAIMTLAYRSQRFSEY